MQHSTLLKTSLLITAALGLAACQNLTQAPASVQDGTTNIGSGNVVTTTLPNNNPYGTVAVNDPYGTTTSYTPPASSTSTPPAVSTGGAYVGNYSPVDVNAVYHTIASGDTVYNISKRYGISQEQVRLWNNLPDNNLRLGTRLRVKPLDYVASAGPITTSSTSNINTTVPTVTTQTTTVIQPEYTNSSSLTSNATSTVTTQTTTINTPVKNSATREVGGITWMNPTQGNIISQFTTLNKGIDIAGNSGQNVVAAADGKVVYSGSDLRGYGNLVIVQHNATYLSAYGHNQKILVKENDNVKRGQVIAHLGNTHTDRYKLHFEVRQNGKPVNPLDYIPN